MNKASNRFIEMAAVAALASGCAGAPSAPAPDAQSAVANDRYRQGLDHLEAGDYAAAERILLELTQAQAGLGGPYVNLGIVYANTDRPVEAEAAFREAIARNPANAEAWNQLGILLRKDGRFRDADAAYRQALAVEPDYANAHLNLGVLYDLYLQEPEVAVLFYERYHELTAGEDRTVGKWIAEVRRRIPSDTRTAELGEQ